MEARVDDVVTTAGLGHTPIMSVIAPIVRTEETCWLDLVTAAPADGGEVLLLIRPATGRRHSRDARGG